MLSQQFFTLFKVSKNFHDNHKLSHWLFCFPSISNTAKQLHTLLDTSIKPLNFYFQIESRTRSSRSKKSQKTKSTKKLKLDGKVSSSNSSCFWWKGIKNEKWVPNKTTRYKLWRKSYQYTPSEAWKKRETQSRLSKVKEEKWTRREIKTKNCLSINERQRRGEINEHNFESGHRGDHSKNDQRHPTTITLLCLITLYWLLHSPQSTTQYNAVVFHWLNK